MDRILKWTDLLILMILSVFAPIKGLIITTALMIAVDLLSGILAARKRGEAITSAGLRRTVSKLFVYEVSVCMSYLAEHYMTTLLPFVKMSSTMIAIVEMKSIYENMNTISGNDIFQSLITKLGSANSPTCPKKY